MKLRKLISWLLDAGTWFYTLGILTLLGAAITINFVVEFAVDSQPMLIACASLTAILLSLSFIPSIQKMRGGVIVTLVLAATAAAFTWWQLEDSVRSSAVTIPPIPSHLNFSFGFTILAAILALVLWWKLSGERVYNPQLTLVQNGVTLIGVLASAIAFNLPVSWSFWVGWAIITGTLMWLGPIWKSEAAAAAQLGSLRAKIVELEAEIERSKERKEERPLPGFRNLLKRLIGTAKRTQS